MSKSRIQRRQFIATSAQLVSGVALLAGFGPSLHAQATGSAAPAAATPPPTPVTPPPAPPAPPPKPPALLPDQAKGVVSSAHRSLEAVTKWVTETPLLVNSCWDWGGGDFETPLEAAAHTGQREIAEFLLAKGARPSLFAAGMLGQLKVVQAMLEIDPQAHAIPGPHGFTLWHCVLKGGERAAPVRDWLRAQGVPEETQRPLPYIWPEGTRPPAA